MRIGSFEYMVKKQYNKQHYINQMKYICECIKKEISYNLEEITVDNFAGGGGAGTGIEEATGYSTYAAINHDPEAIRMHKANHPSTKHYCESVWDVDPLEVCDGHPVGLAWFSPDCKHFSKAKGGKPVEKNIRGLAWIVLKWAALVRPRVIMLENVEEFQTWGPCITLRDENTGRVVVNMAGRHNRKKNEPRTRVAEPGEVISIDKQIFMPDPQRKGQTYKQWCKQLKDLGYEIETKELVAADYGTPTMRKRFFMIARCDEKPIIWPEPTHGPADSKMVKSGLMQPYVGAYTQLDFSLPCPSIFDTAEEIRRKYGIRAVRPLASNTMERIARGLRKFVLENSEPFIVQCNHGGERRTQDIREPMPTITGKHGFGVVEPYIVPIGYGERKGQEPRVHDIEGPLPTIVSSGKHYLCEPYMVQIGQTGFTQDRSKDVRDPLTTIVSKNEHCLICPTLIQYHSETTAREVRGQNIKDPIMTVDGSGRYGLVASFLHKYYDGGYTGAGSDLKDPLPTITAIDHNSVCMAHIVKMKGTNIGQDMDAPLQTITAGGMHYGNVYTKLQPVAASFVSQMQGQSVGKDLREPINTMTGINHMAEVRAFLIKYYGQGTGQELLKPLDTITAQDRFGLVAVEGVDYQIVDIGLRMLEPKELYGCNGAPDDYIIDRDCDGKKISRTEQVKKCGNMVCPPMSAALVRANLAELCKCKRMPNMRIVTEQTGQLKFA